MASGADGADAKGADGLVLPGAPDGLVAGKYRLDRLIGKGGAGVVVSAMNVAKRERVAIKFLRSDLKDPKAARRFTREARAAGMIHSDHVARVLDVGKLANGSPFMVMEHLDGKDLHDLLGEGRMPVPRVVELVLQACAGLAEAHRVGVIHRDLTPANLFVVQGPGDAVTLKILDFGISKIMAPRGGAARGAEGGMTTMDVLGSPGYMSPEQLESTRDVDLRTDIWALGVVLYEALTGLPAFKANNPLALCKAVREAEPVAVREICPDVPAGLEAVVMRCLRKRPDDRYASIEALAMELRPFAPPRAAPLVDRVAAIAAHPPASRVRRRRLVAIAALAGLIALALLAVAAFARW